MLPHCTGRMMTQDVQLPVCTETHIHLFLGNGLGCREWMIKLLIGVLWSEEKEGADSVFWPTVTTTAILHCYWSSHRDTQHSINLHTDRSRKSTSVLLGTTTATQRLTVWQNSCHANTRVHRCKKMGERKGKKTAVTVTQIKQWGHFEPLVCMAACQSVCLPLQT